MDIGADIHYIQNQSGEIILHFACLSGQPRAMKWCLDKGAMPNKVTLGNQTPLHLNVQASHTPNIEIIKDLILAGADVTIMDDSNCTVLHYSCIKRYWGREIKRQIVELFIMARCLSHSAFALWNTNTMHTPLSLLLTQGEYDLCELLVEAGYQTQCDATLPYILQYMQNIPDR